MKQIEEKEALPLLEKLVMLREGSKTDKSLMLEYREHEAFCADIFDYIVVSRASRYKTFANYQDLIQEGRIALLYSLRNFDLAKGSFFWWANQYVKTKMSREANRHSTIKIPIKHAKTMTPYKMSSIPVMIVSKTPESDAEFNQALHKISVAVEMLPENQKNIIKLNGLENKSINKISKMLKMSSPNCIKLLSEARNNLRNNLKLLDN